MPGLLNPKVINLMISESKGFECCLPKWNHGFIEPFFAIYPVVKGYEKAKDILINENYGLINFIDKNWKINYISVENQIQPIDKNLLSLIIGLFFFSLGRHIGILPTREIQ